MRAAPRRALEICRRYASIHHQPPVVEANDVLFALHAAAATVVTLLQVWRYGGIGGLSRWCFVALVVVIVAVAAYVVVCLSFAPAFVHLNGAAAAAATASVASVPGVASIGGGAAEGQRAAAAAAAARYLAASDWRSWLSFFTAVSYVPITRRLFGLVPDGPHATRREGPPSLPSAMFFREPLLPRTHSQAAEATAATDAAAPQCVGPIVA